MRTRAEKAAYMRKFRAERREEQRAYYRERRARVGELYKKANPDKVALAARQRERVKSGIRLETCPLPDVDQRCEICGVREDRSTPLHLDHDHSTGAFRGWLCGLCNRGIGALGDCSDRLFSALVYLEAR